MVSVKRKLPSAMWYANIRLTNREHKNVYEDIVIEFNKIEVLQTRNKIRIIERGSHARGLHRQETQLMKAALCGNIREGVKKRLHERKIATC